MQTGDIIEHDESGISLLSGDSYLRYAMSVIMGKSRLIVSRAHRDWLSGNFVSPKFAHLSFAEAVLALLEEEDVTAKASALHFATLMAPVCPPQRLSSRPKLGLKTKRRHLVRAPPRRRIGLSSEYAPCMR